MISRRRLITAAAGAGLLSVAPNAFGPAWIAAAERDSAGPWQWQGTVSANGWTIDPGMIVARRVEGSAAMVALRDEAAGTVLLHVARRWHYEIATLDTPEGGGLTGHTTERTVNADFESNHLSGTALALHPAAYPLRGSEALWPHHEQVVRDILADCAGTVVWGGDLTPTKRSHFHITARPYSLALSRVAERLRTDIHTATRPVAGTPTDPTAPDRRAQADRLHRAQTGLR